jgi:hypothetical protein
MKAGAQGCVGTAGSGGHEGALAFGTARVGGAELADVGPRGGRAYGVFLLRVGLVALQRHGGGLVGDLRAGLKGIALWLSQRKR